MKSIIENNYHKPNGIDENGQQIMLKKTRGKDNNGVFISRNPYGYGNINKVRYPSKKRSRQVWKRFYTLFPNLAIKDNWNGKTSNKMK